MQYKLFLPQFNNICVKPTKTYWMWPFFVLQYCCFHCDFILCDHIVISWDKFCMEWCHSTYWWLCSNLTHMARDCYWDLLFSSALQTLLSHFSPYHTLWTFGPLPFLSRNIFILWVAFIISTIAHTITYVKKLKSWFEITISKVENHRDCFFKFLLLIFLYSEILCYENYLCQLISYIC